MKIGKLNRNGVLLALACVFFASSGAHAVNFPKVVFSECTEFVGVAPVDAAAARALVPGRYDLVADASGAQLVVRVADCQAVRVGASVARPGRVAQIGIIIVSPDGTATDPDTSINNYTLAYATNSLALYGALRVARVPAVLDRDLACELTPVEGTHELYAAVTPRSGVSPTWFVHGTVMTPSFPTPFLANWWSARGAAQTKMATNIPTIYFDFTSDVSFYTSHNNLIGHLIRSNRIAGFPLSFRGQFASATMTIDVGL